MVVMVPRQYFQLMNCEGSAISEALATSSSLAACQCLSHISRFLVGLAIVLQLWQ